jgi:hypothetical protein
LKNCLASIWLDFNLHGEVVVGKKFPRAQLLSVTAKHQDLG